jgi:hypothetical protein
VNRVVPVAVFAFRRADMLARTVNALRANKVPLIHAFSDGPRNAADEAGVAEVRRVLHGIDWAEVHLVERSTNLGLDASVISGVSSVLALHDEIVICEEDIVFTSGTYAYMSAALAQYRDEPRVMSINGWTHARMTPPDAHSAPYFTGRFTEWGWATWRRAWAGYPELSRNELRDRCAARGIDLGKYGRDISDWFTTAGDHDAWDYNFNLHMMLNDGLALLPPQAMTEHIGYDNRSSHQQDRTAWKDRAQSPPLPSEVRWPEVRENAASAPLWRRAMELPPRPSLAKRIMRRLVRLFKGSVKRGPGV